jgi:hypothetical protein
MAGRRAATIEFLARLVEWAGGRQKFCRLTAIHHGNLSDYLNGKKSITWKRLEAAARHVCGEPPAFEPLVEGWDLWTNGVPKRAQLTTDAGVYALYDSAMRTIYFGKAGNLDFEIRQTLKRDAPGVRHFTGHRKLKFEYVAVYLSAYRIIRGDADFRHDVEALGLKVLVNSTLNRRGAIFKRTG